MKDTHTELRAPRESFADLCRRLAEGEKAAQKMLEKITDGEIASRIVVYRGDGVLKG